MSQVNFRYKAIDRRGARTRGVLQAATPEEAYRRIKAAGLRPLRLKAGRPAGSGWRSTSVGPRELAQLTCQLAVLVEAGIPIADGLRSGVVIRLPERKKPS